MDLLDSLEKWVQEGNYIILVADLNEYVVSGKFVKKLVSVVLHEVISSKYKFNLGLELIY